MSSTAPIQYEQANDRDALFGSGNWALDDGTRIAVAPAPGVAPQRIASLVRWAFVFAAISSISSCPDPWIESQQQRAQFTMAAAFQPYGRRRISSVEARRLALEILYRAEAERVAIAQAEAERGINWEEVS